MVIGFFAPLPVPLMIPFMAVQSAAMMYQAGANWQFGKRKISAMTNEEFNPMTFNDLMIKNNADLVKAIPTMQQAIKEFTPLMATIINEFANYINEASKALPDFFQQATANTVQGFQNMAHDFNIQLNQETSGISSSAEEIIKALEKLTNIDTYIPPALAETGDTPNLSSDSPDNSAYISKMSLTDLSLENGKIRNGTSKLSPKNKNSVQFYYALALQKKRETGDILPPIPAPDAPVSTKTVSQITQEYNTYIGQFANNWEQIKNAIGQYENNKLDQHKNNYNYLIKKFYTWLTSKRQKSNPNYKIRVHAQSNYTQRRWKSIYT